MSWRFYRGILGEKDKGEFGNEENCTGCTRNSRKFKNINVKGTLCKSDLA